MSKKAHLVKIFFEGLTFDSGEGEFFALSTPSSMRDTNYSKNAFFDTPTIWQEQYVAISLIYNLNKLVRQAMTSCKQESRNTKRSTKLWQSKPQKEGEHRDERSK